MSRRAPRRQAERPDSPAGPDRTPDASPPPATSRRAFLWKTWIGLAAVAMLEAVWVLVDLLRPRRPAVAESAAVIVAGPVARFAPGSVTAFPAGRFYLVCLEDGGFLAVSRECTHLGCTVPWSEPEGRFVCPCHGSAFDLRGDVLQPPAPRALDVYEVRIENRIVKVNTANVRRRSSFDPRQVTRA